MNSALNVSNRISNFESKYDSELSREEALEIAVKMIEENNKYNIVYEDGQSNDASIQEIIQL